MPKLGNRDREHLIKRMRESAPMSAEEELLLARAFAEEFGKSAILGPSGNASVPRPEFTVKIENSDIAIEAKGLLDSAEVQGMNQAVRQLGQSFWVSDDPSIGDPKRVRSALAKKILKSARHSPCIVVLTLYSGFDWPSAFDLARRMAMTPDRFCISNEDYPLAAALVYDKLIQGVWFNAQVSNRIGISDENKEHVRTALKRSFYPRDDAQFLHEKMTDAEHQATLDNMLSKGA